MYSKNKLSKELILAALARLDEVLHGKDIIGEADDVGHLHMDTHRISSK